MNNLTGINEQSQVESKDRLVLPEYKRVVKTYMVMEIIPKEPSLYSIEKNNLPSPSAGGFGVSIQGKELRFDFCESRANVEISKGHICYRMNQVELDCECYKKTWIEEGFIEADFPDEKIEEIIFEKIREADSVDEIYVEFWDETTDDYFDGEIIIHQFFVIDALSGEEIDMINGKVLKEGWNPENVRTNRKVKKN